MPMYGLHSHDHQITRDPLRRCAAVIWPFAEYVQAQKCVHVWVIDIDYMRALNGEPIRSCVVLVIILY